eukprot:g3892.t1
MARRASAEAAMMAPAVKPVVKTTSMAAAMQEKCIVIANECIQAESNEQAIAKAIKASLETHFPGLWHVFVGRNFGCYVTHEEAKFVYFYIGQVGICIFSTT